MDSELIAWVLAIALGVAVLGLGLRRNLSDLTQDWLPRYREVSKAPPGTEDRLLHAAGAALFAIGAVVFMLRSPSSSVRD